MTLQQSKTLVLSAIALFKRCANAVRLHNYSDKSMRVMQRAEARVMRRSRLNTQLFKQYQFLDSAELAPPLDSAENNQEANLCPTCKGEGQVSPFVSVEGNFSTLEREECPHCCGTGEYNQEATLLGSHVIYNDEGASLYPSCEHVYDHAERCVLCGFFVDELTEDRVGG